MREIADIIPNEDKLTHEQKCILGIVAVETIAEKAYCFEKLQNGMDNENFKLNVDKPNNYIIL